MKIVKLKEDFVQKAINIDSEFEQKHWRGYALVVTNKRSNYLIPLRSRCKHSHCFKNEISGKFLDYSKSFELINDNIIESSLSMEKSEYMYYQQNISTIKKELQQFNRIRKKFDYAVNIEKIKKVQQAYKK